jgi:hypothetical protein
MTGGSQWAACHQRFNPFSGLFFSVSYFTTFAVLVVPSV